jgi:nucleotide-binding universal stress UspA family protein
MRKIVLATDGINFSDAAFEFAKRINESDPILLTGVFLPHVSYANIWSYADGVGAPIFVPALEDADIEMIEKNVASFEERCRKHHIEYRVHKDLSDLALPELKKESRFADLLLIGTEKFYENFGSGNPNNYLKDALHHLECPVLLVPEKFTFPEVNILAYDSTESSVFALKLFAYLLPEFTSNPTMLIYANIDGEKAIPNESYMEELVGRHFENLTITKLEVDSRKQFNTWITDKRSVILVAGSFERSAISRLFKPSFVNEIIKEHKLPVFIVHK